LSNINDKHEERDASITLSLKGGKCISISFDFDLK
jgi:hypothetical protein